MKIFKYFTYLILLIVGLNLLTWLIYGRDSIILNAPNFFDYSCYATNADTLFVYAGYEDDQKYFPGSSSFGDFRSSSKEIVLDSLSKKSNSVVVYEDQILETSLPDSFMVVNFWSNIHRKYPFYARLNTGESAIGFGAHYNQSWVWFFKWYPVPSSMVTGCS